MNRDLVIGLVGGILLLAAVVGVLVYEARNAPATTLTYPITWRVEDAGASQRSDTLEEGEQARFAFDLGALNATELVVELTWEDDAGQPDTFNLSVRHPTTGETRNASSSNGTLRITYPLNPVPSRPNVTATGRATAMDLIRQEHEASVGQGTWNVSVELASAPGQRPVPQAQQLETQPDGSNSFELTFSYEIYRAQLKDPAIEA